MVYNEDDWIGEKGPTYPNLSLNTGRNLQPRMVLAIGATQPGTLWLDIATGTGTLALMAARLGAAVTGQDMSPRMIALAKDSAAAAGLDVKFDVGDCQAMPYPDQSFEVVTSAHGAAWAPDHAAVARELIRLCRPGGRMAISSFSPQGGFLELAELEAEFAGEGSAAHNSPFEWGDPDYVGSLLDEAFSLKFLAGSSPIRGDSPAALTQLFLKYSPRTAALKAALGPEREPELAAALEAFFTRHSGPSGVVVNREYLITVGKRKG